MQAARAEFKAMYHHQWAMSHCREKAEHLLLNTQHAHSALLCTLIRQRCWLLNTKRTVSAGLRTRGALLHTHLTPSSVPCCVCVCVCVLGLQKGKAKAEGAQ
jgi:hypothetical protein